MVATKNSNTITNSNNGKFDEDQEALSLLRRHLDKIEECVRFLSCTDPDAEEKNEEEGNESDSSLNMVTLIATY